MTDIELFLAIEKSDEAAFNSLFTKYYKPLVAYIKVYTHDTALAEDIVQQTFIYIWTHKQKLKSVSSAKGYLYTLAYKTYVDHYRTTKRRNTFFDDLKEKALRDAINEDEEYKEKRIKRLQSIIETLPPKCKEILTLNKMRGLKQQEISELLNISKKTVEAQIRIAYKKIREGFDNDNIILFLLNKFSLKSKV